MSETCMTCRYKFTEATMQSFCRRNPPTVFFNPKNGQLISALPPIQPDKQWCGEHQQKFNVVQIGKTLDSIHEGHELGKPPMANYQPGFKMGGDHD